MNEIEEFVGRLCRSLHVENALKEHIREELREHLSEAIECHVREGLPHEEAVRRAIEEFGSAEMIGHELNSIHRGSLLSFLMQKAVSWREQTMKTEWKWNFVALTALVLTMTIQVLLAFACVVFVFPMVAYAFDLREWQLPAISKASFTMARAVDSYWFVTLLVPAGWIAFEVLYKKEAKPNIRLAAFALACVAATVFFAVTSVGALVPAVHALAPRATLTPSSALGIRSAAVLKRKLAEADALVLELSAACDKSQWDLVRDDAHDTYIICQSLTFTGAANLMKIVGKPEIADEPQIQRLLMELADRSDSMARRARSQDLRSVLDDLARVKRHLGELHEALRL
jgi:hypothetical protein